MERLVIELILLSVSAICAYEVGKSHANEQHAIKDQNRQKESIEKAGRIRSTLNDDSVRKQLQNKIDRG